ncbi:MAG: dTDP-4-dehydrorhamnose reductase [Ignavibacteriales bacterium]|nr:dTDP-4-dehydrorhamnose reductase [Ignavibacteriales bacterium]
MMIKKRILIVGSNGMLGQSLIEMLKFRSDIELCLSSAEDFSYFGDLNYSKIDIADKKNVKNLVMNFYPDFIINTAAYTNVDKCETERELAWSINVNGVENLAKYSVPSNAHLIHISSDYVFDGKEGPYTEQDIPNPISYYGRSKLAGENIIKRFNIKNTIIRTNVLFGSTKYGRPDFVKWVFDSLTKNQKIKIVTDQINNPTFINDIASAIIEVCDLGKTGIYNIGGNEFLNRFEFTRKIAQFFNLDFSLVEPILTKDLNQPAQRPLKSGLINLKAETEFNYKPKSLEQCFQNIKKFWNENESN